jgi:hypothetical protein
MPRAFEMAIQARAQGDYDAYALMVDTDQHWDDASRSRAQVNDIVVVENVPCLEATLLRVDGQNFFPATSDNKSAFKDAYGGPAHRDGVIRRHFPRTKFDTARERVAAIDRLLNLIRC